GLTQTSAELGWKNEFVEADDSAKQAAYDKFIADKCDLIVAIGFTEGDRLMAAAAAHPTQDYEILDFLYDPPISNVWAEVFAVDQSSFMAGYLAAAMSVSGKVATFGGLQIPPVTLF